MVDNIYMVKRKDGEPIISCTGKRMGVYKRRKAKRYTKPSKCKTIVIGK